jgi:hypothetical protein
MSYCTYTITDESGLLTIEHTLGIRYQWDCGRQATRIDPAEPCGPVDIAVVSVAKSINGGELVTLGAAAVREFNDKLNADTGLFAEIELRCADDHHERMLTAEEDHYEQMMQSQRDGE